MKKKLFCLLLILVLPISLLLVGCSNKSANSSIGQNYEDQEKFVMVEYFSPGNSFYFEVLVNKATKVMYLVDADGAITVMVNPDGTPMIYQGELE